MQTISFHVTEEFGQTFLVFFERRNSQNFVPISLSVWGIKNIWIYGKNCKLLFTSAFIYFCCCLIKWFSANASSDTCLEEMSNCLAWILKIKYQDGTGMKVLNLIVCRLNVLQKGGNKVFLKQHQGTVDLKDHLWVRVQGFYGSFGHRHLNKFGYIISLFLQNSLP